MTDLGLVETRALIAELQRRHAAGLMLLEETRVVAGRRDDLRGISWWGGVSTCLGLAVLLQEEILEHWRRGELPAAGEGGGEF